MARISRINNRDDRRRVNDRDEKRRDDYNEERENVFADIQKKYILQLIKSRDVNSISSDCVDEIRYIMNHFLVYMFEQFSDDGRPTTAESSDVKSYMSFYLEDEEKELPQEVVLPSREMEKAILSVCDRFRIRIRRDVLTLVHMFLECIVFKIIKGALIIGDLGKTKRLSGKEIKAAYKIYMM